MPAGFLVDPRLATEAPSTTGSRPSYLAALTAAGNALGETTRRDADHAWLAPVKAASDMTRVAMFGEAGLVDDEFVADALAVDMTNPALSSSRCNLLRFVPRSASPSWRAELTAALAASMDPAAQEFHGNLVDPARTAAAHRDRAKSFAAACQTKAADPTHVASLVRLVAQRRVEFVANEIGLRLASACDVVE